MSAPAADEIRYLGDLQRLQLKPGDRLVLSFPGKLTQEMVAGVKASFEQWAGDVPVMVLTDGAKLGVVGSEE